MGIRQIWSMIQMQHPVVNGYTIKTPLFCAKLNQIYTHFHVTLQHNVIQIVMCIKFALQTEMVEMLDAHYDFCV